MRFRLSVAGTRQPATLSPRSKGNLDFDVVDVQLQSLQVTPSSNVDVPFEVEVSTSGDSSAEGKLSEAPVLAVDVDLASLQESEGLCCINDMNGFDSCRAKASYF